MNGSLLKMTGRCELITVQRREYHLIRIEKLWMEGGHKPVASSYAPSHDWQSGEHLVTSFEIDTQSVRAQDIDEIVVTFVYMQLRQERDVRRY